jgi:hypothetical protein
MSWRVAIALLACVSVAHAQGVSFGPLGPGATAPPGQTPGVTDGTSAAAGKVGEVVTAQANAESIAATFTSGSPTVVTMAANTFGTRCSVAVGSANQCVLPVTFTGLVGTNGVANNTAYYVDPASISGSTFKIATSVANALAGTDVNTIGTDSGTGVAAAYITTTGVGQAVMAINVTPGDWQCTGNLGITGVASTAITVLIVGAAGAAGTLNVVNGSAQQLVVNFIVGAFTSFLALPVFRRNSAAAGLVYWNASVGWTGGATNPTASGFEFCRRMR